MKALEKIRKYYREKTLFSHGLNFFRYLLQSGEGFLYRKIVCPFVKVQPGKIFCMTFDYDFSCNPAAIVEELLRRNAAYDIVWVVSAETVRENFPKELRLVKYGSIAMYYEQASAEIWLDNALGCLWHQVRKKPGQTYINTWHGSLGIKRLGGSKKWLRKAARCNQATDFCITNSVFEERVMKDSFWPDVEKKRFGHPRNDVLFSTADGERIRREVREKLGVEGKMFLFAPTFRDDLRTEAFSLDFERLRSALEQRFGGKWTILVKLHFKNRKHSLPEGHGAHVIDISGFTQIQELMLAADAGMTDYSSWIFDFILLRRPAFLYAPDMEKYENSRGLYYPLSETPFSVAMDEMSLERNILNFDEMQYLERVESFLQAMGCYEDGHASERTATLIENLREKQREKPKRVALSEF